MADIFDQVAGTGEAPSDAPATAQPDVFDQAAAQPAGDPFEHAAAQAPQGDVFDQVAQAPQPSAEGQAPFYAPSRLVPAVTRLGGAALSPVGGLPGAAAASATETLAEIEERMFGTRPALEPREIGAAGAVGMLPFGRAAEALGVTGRIGRALAGAGEGATLGVAGDVLHSELAKGDLPSVGEVATSAGLGTVLGAAGGALGTLKPTGAPAGPTDYEIGRLLTGEEQARQSVRTMQAKETLTREPGARDYAKLDEPAKMALNDKMFEASKLASQGRQAQAASLFTPDEARMVGPAQLVMAKAEVDMRRAGLQFGHHDYYAPMLVQNPVKLQNWMQAQGQAPQPGTGLAVGRLMPRPNVTLAQMRLHGDGLVTEDLNQLAMLVAGQEGQLAWKKRVLDEAEAAGHTSPQYAPGLVQIDPRLTKELQKGTMFVPADLGRALNDEMIFKPMPRLANAALGVTNGMRQSKLIGSFFHYFFTGWNALGSGLGRARGDLESGQPIRAAGTALRTLTGIDAMRAWREGSQAFTEASKVGDLTNNLPQQVETAIRGGFNFDTSRRMNVSLNQLMQDATRGPGMEQLGRVGAVYQRLADAVSAPLMEHLIPNLKLGLALREVQSREQQLGRPMTDKEVNDIFRGHDAIYGQMANYNSPFMQRTRQFLNTIIQFPGWNIGTGQLIKHAATGAGKLALGLPRTEREVQANRYALGLTMAMALVGAITHRVLTGQDPQELTDVFFPWDGTYNPDGSKSRIQWQNYLRDWMHLSKGVPARLARGEVGPALGHLAQNALQKMQSMASVMVQIPVELAQNQTARGERIFDPEGGLASNALSLAQLVGSHAVPFAAQPYTKGGRPNPLGPVGQFAGVQRAPAFLSQTEAEAEASDIARERARGQGPMTPEAAARANSRSELKVALRSGAPDAAQRLEQALADGSVLRSELKRFLTDVGLPPVLARVHGFGLEDTLRVYRLADQNERRMLLPFVLQKARSAARTGNVRALQALDAFGGL